MKRIATLMVLTVAMLMHSLPSNASIITFAATLDGLSESPPNASPGTGFATVIFDDVANTLEVKVTFSDLIGTTTASHIHCCTAAPGTGTVGVATTTPTFPDFPLGVTSGTYDKTLDLLMASSYNPAFVTAQGGVAEAQAALISGLLADTAYLNIHSSFAPGGEIRGFLQAVPEPATIALLGIAVAGLGFSRRRKLH